MGLARHNFTGRRKFCGHLGSKFFILRAASPAARSLEVTIRGLPDIKVRQAPSLIHSTRKRALRHKNFLGVMPVSLPA